MPKRCRVSAISCRWTLQGAAGGSGCPGPRPGEPRVVHRHRRLRVRAGSSSASRSAIRRHSPRAAGCRRGTAPAPTSSCSAGRSRDRSRARASARARRQRSPSCSAPWRKGTAITSSTSGMRRSDRRHPFGREHVDLRARDLLQPREQGLRHQRVADPVRRDDEDARQLMTFDGCSLVDVLRAAVRAKASRLPSPRRGTRAGAGPTARVPGVGQCSGRSFSVTSI